MAGLGGVQRDRDRLGIPELADEDDVGGLPERVPEADQIGFGVDPHLALRDDALIRVVQELHGILDRDHVAP